MQGGRKYFRNSHMNKYIPGYLAKEHTPAIKP